MFTIQCTLPINLFNEKIFIFIWFWLVFVAVITFYSLFFWILSLTNSSRREFIKRYFNYKIYIQQNTNNNNNNTRDNVLETNPFYFSVDTASIPTRSLVSQLAHVNLNVNRNKKIFKMFVSDYLKFDGIFMLQMVKKNTNDIIVGEIVHLLWTHFNK
jgi:hypothetical protein